MPLPNILMRKLSRSDCFAIAFSFLWLARSLPRYITCISPFPRRSLTGAIVPLPYDMRMSCYRPPPLDMRMTHHIRVPKTAWWRDNNVDGLFGRRATARGRRQQGCGPYLGQETNRVSRRVCRRGIDLTGVW